MRPRLESRCLLFLCILSVVVVLSPRCEAQGDGPMLRPQRPAEFQREGEVKAYLEKLREWLEDSSRKNSRYGKRNFGPIRNQLKEEHIPKWKNDYDYYTQYMNI